MVLDEAQNKTASFHVLFVPHQEAKLADGSSDVDMRIRGLNA